MIRDNTGRSAERPFYKERDPDKERERLIRNLLPKRHGKVDYPVATDDLTVLIDVYDAQLDSYADLSAYGADVEWVTELFPNRGPKVSIWERIAADERCENRFRNTLTHEFGHVKFHGPLLAEKFATGDMLERGLNANKAISKRDNILDDTKSDWMKWQVGFISGPLLMPAMPVGRLVSNYCSPRELHERHLQGSRELAGSDRCDGRFLPASHQRDSGREYR